MAADTCIKFCAEFFLKFQEEDIIVMRPSDSMSLANICKLSLFANPVEGQQKIHDHLRWKKLFSDKNRGVVLSDDTDKKFTHDFGIVNAEYTPQKLKDYFTFPVYSARFTYSPNLTGFVATWLTERYLPIIAGTSGSTEQMMSRVLPLVDLTHEEIKILLLAQTASMIAMGHHSFFECMLVTKRFGFLLHDPDKMIDLYLQCIPDTIRKNSAFQDFLKSSEGSVLLKNMAYSNDEDSLSSSSNSGSFLLSNLSNSR
jgi:hypothetical protein